MTCFASLCAEDCSGVQGECADAVASSRASSTSTAKRMLAGLGLAVRRPPIVVIDGHEVGVFEMYGRITMTPRRDGETTRAPGHVARREGGARRAGNARDGSWQIGIRIHVNHARAGWPVMAALFTRMWSGLFELSERCREGVNRSGIEQIEISEHDTLDSSQRSPGLVAIACRNDYVGARRSQRAHGFDADARIPPVTMAVLLLRSMPRMTSAAVEAGPKPD